VESGYEYDEYLNSEGWSAEKYSGRLNVLAQAIGGLEPEAPDILALEEVENAGVLEDLAAGSLYLPLFPGGLPAAAPGARRGRFYCSRRMLYFGKLMPVKEIAELANSSTGTVGRVIYNRGQHYPETEVSG
jgi:hypothetical protein